MNVTLVSFTGHSIVKFTAPDPFKGLSELLAEVAEKDDEDM